MSLWPAQFITNMTGKNLHQQYNVEILNNTSLNFARPGTPTDSLTASMTAERRNLREQLPQLSINMAVSKKYMIPQENDLSQKKSDTRNKRPTALKSPDRTGNAEVTQTGNRVKFANLPTIHHNTHNNTHNKTHNKTHRRVRTEGNVADPDNESKEEEKHEKHEKHERHEKHEVHINVIRKQKSKRQLKTYRRASAPAQGMDYQEINHYFKSKKQAHQKIPIIHVEVDEPVDDSEDNVNKVNNNVDNVDNVNNVVDKVNNDNDHDHRHDRNMNSSISSSVASLSSTISHCNPPSLSPCSSNSSLSSSVDMTSPALKPPQPYVNFSNPWAIKQKPKHIPIECHESHSLPDIVSSSYNDAPWSPAAMFLASFANPAIKQPLPDEEGQQVGEYIIGKVIGRGGFSTVKQAYTLDNYSGSMETVAVKIVRNITDSDDNDRIQALLDREIAIWRRLDHPNIVQMLAVEETDYATFIFSEYCPGGTLLDYVKKHCVSEGRGLDEDEARNIFLEVAEVVRYLHNDMRLVHKDIKLDNILLDEDDTWKVCDFGLTEFLSSANGFNDVIYNSAVGGSIAYCAPEQLRTPTPLKDPSVDVWSLGVLLFAMITGQLPFSDSFGPRLQFKIINGRYDEMLLEDCGASSELKDLLKGMFKTKPDQRLTINQVLEHQWCER